MTIEDKVFQRKRFVAEKLERFGFQKTDNGFEYACDFMDGSFRAILTVDGAGSVKGTVIDKMNDEEYAQLRIESFNGAYVNSVRASYEELLESIAARCCKDVLFVSDQANRIADRIMAKYGVGPDFPWEQSRYRGYGTFRHADTNKWFALIMNVKWDVLLKNGNPDTVDVVNLRIDPVEGDALRKAPGIYPGYHMNHRTWISVVLDETLSDETVMCLIETSFDLTR